MSFMYRIHVLEVPVSVKNPYKKFSDDNSTTMTSREKMLMRKLDYTFDFLLKTIYLNNILRTG